MKRPQVLAYRRRSGITGANVPAGGQVAACYRWIPGFTAALVGPVMATTALPYEHLSRATASLSEEQRLVAKQRTGSRIGLSLATYRATHVLTP